MPAQIRSINPADAPTGTASNGSPMPSGASPSPGATAPAGGLYAIDEIRAELARLAGRVEELERQVSSGEGVAALEKRVTTLEARGSTPPSPTLTVDQTLAKAQTELQQGRAESAISLLSDALKIAAPGQIETLTFWRGEAFLAAKEHRKAILDFSTVTEKYPKSLHAPKSLLRIGQAFEALNMREDAKAFYQELRERFPQSSAAKEIKPVTLTPSQRPKSKAVR